ncbi:MAG TPA: hypothetical protein VLV83_08765 [Acidobacteriota bacterium]|nr:hypothetical protein [Acidobacteriota bacterium]
MGRRKHRDWKLDLEARNRVDWKGMARPLDWGAIFGRRAPLEVEVGFGNGEYLCELAEDNPQHDFVGLEVKGFRLKKALWRLERRQIENVRLMLVDARVALQRLFRQRTIRCLHSLFCDPWPKARHEKFRLFSYEFLKLLNSRLEDGGEAFIVTDHEPFSQWILEEASDTGLSAEHRLAAPNYGTKFERKWRMERSQERFHEIRLRKRRHLDIPVVADQPLDFPQIIHFDPQCFSPGRARGEMVVEFRKWDWKADQQRLSILAITVDEALLQRVWMTVRREGSQWKLELDSPEEVIPTPAVQKALELAAAAST